MRRVLFARNKAPVPENVETVRQQGRLRRVVGHQEEGPSPAVFQEQGSELLLQGLIQPLQGLVPQENVPASDDCTFRIEYRTSLTAGDWATLVEDLAATSKNVNLADLGTPPSLFLRLFWTNKVKE